MPKSKHILTDKQLRFCQEYVIDLNGTQAAIRAGYSQKTANRIAEQNLSKLDIKEQITALKSKISTKLEVTAERLINEYCKIAFGNVTDILNVDTDGTVTLKADLKDLPREITDCISEISSSETTTLNGGSKHFKIKQHCKLEALKKLGEHLGIFKNISELNIKNITPQFLVDTPEQADQLRKMYE